MCELYIADVSMIKLEVKVPEESRKCHMELGLCKTGTHLADSQEGMTNAYLMPRQPRVPLPKPTEYLSKLCPLRAF